MFRACSAAFCLFILGSGPAAAQAAGCYTIAFIGRLVEQTQGEAVDAGHLLGQNAFQAVFAVDQVLAGAPPAGEVRANGIAHALLNRDIAAWTVFLSKDDAGEFWIEGLETSPLASVEDRSQSSLKPCP